MDGTIYTIGSLFGPANKMGDKQCKKDKNDLSPLM